MAHFGNYAGWEFHLLKPCAIIMSHLSNKERKIYHPQEVTLEI